MGGQIAELRRPSRRQIIKGAGAIAVGLAAYRAAPATAADTVREGIQTGALGSLRETLPGVEDKYGLKYDIKDFNDSSAALLALDQGDLDIANTTSQHLVRAMEEGIDVVMVMGWGGGYNVLVAGKSLDLKPNDWAALKAAALKRKAAGDPIRIGVPTGSLQHASLIYVLKAAGIDPDKDVSVVNVPFPTHPRALEGGQIDMAMTLSVFGALAINKGDAKLFNHVVSTPSGKQEIGFIVQRKLIRQKPDLVQRIVSSHVAAMDQFVGNVEEQIKLEEKYTKLPEPVVAMQQRDMLRYDYRINVDEIRGMAKEMYELGWVKRDYSADVGKYVDLDFLSKATGKSVAYLSVW